LYITASSEVARPSQEFLQLWIVGREGMPPGGRCMVGDHVAEAVEEAEVGDPEGVVHRIGGGEIEGEAEAFEVLAEVLEVRVALVELPVGRELLLEEDADPGISDASREDQSAFGVEVAAEALEMGGEEQDQPAKVLVFQVGVGRRQSGRRGALILDLGEAGEPIGSPDVEGGGGHWVLRVRMGHKAAKVGRGTIRR
jgi:hypothetical protein